MSPLPANDAAPPVSLADLLTQAADLQRQIDAVEAAQERFQRNVISSARALAEASLIRDRFAVADGPMFGAAVQQLAAETAAACAFPPDQEEAS